VFEAARSPQARRGLGSRRRLYARLARTRRLLRLWRAIGRHVEDPERRLSRTDAGELLRLLGKVDEELGEFPPPLGEAGQPGYMLVALTEVNARTIQALAPSQRESLRRDWEGGLNFLQFHRDFVLGRLLVLRRMGKLERALHAARTRLNEQPLIGLALFALGLLALFIAIWRTFG
jgi:hypothetical protein